MSSADAPAPEATAVEPEAEPTDDIRSGLLATLELELGEAIVESHLKPGIGLWVRVTTEAWNDAAVAARDKLGCTFFDFLSGIDWMPSPFGRYEVADIDTEVSLAEKVAAARAADRISGYAGGDTRFQVFARVVNVTAHHDVVLKCDVPEDTLTVPTWSRTYAGSNWHEREACEMFGIRFDGHPDLRKLYLPGEFEGHPLRKDFPLLSRVVKPWPGIVDVEPMPGEVAADGDAAEEEVDG
ncbi:MAG: NADH-quinone oxidoreductase subunit C [Actinomycetota bacterium]|nr:NADH-quinone oxidoreductase subunit C [Acidimicrobiia bacterium]MDQ3293663.1 NADH-quinone oxidoreductase subunit C [Actinomycetota bacterium]